MTARGPVPPAADAGPGTLAPPPWARYRCHPRKNKTEPIGINRVTTNTRQRSSARRLSGGQDYISHPLLPRCQLRDHATAPATLSSDSTLEIPNDIGRIRRRPPGSLRATIHRHRPPRLEHRADRQAMSRDEHPLLARENVADPPRSREDRGIQQVRPADPVTRVCAGCLTCAVPRLIVGMTGNHQLIAAS